MKRPILFLVGLYRRFISPLKKPSCRFSPSCSAYFAEAVERYGAFVGVGAGLWRVLRCNPFGSCGPDPVP
ncbi:MAG: membrane protein insertion efficiency factor YidD [Clostridia bacterium]|nr:membrane protein insertion efficiency factor YidD [Clostridia bacterium]